MGKSVMMKMTTTMMLASTHAKMPHAEMVSSALERIVMIKIPFKMMVVSTVLQQLVETGMSGTWGKVRSNVTIKMTMRQMVA